MFTTDCDACGKSMWFFFTRVDGFNVCGRCLKIQKKTGTSMAELVSKNLAAVENAKSARNFRDNVGCLLMLLVVGAGGYAAFQMLVTGGRLVLDALVPVKIEYRDSMIGRGVVFRVQNVGKGPLVNLTVTTMNRAGEKTGEQVFRVVEPGEIVEVGSLEVGVDLAADTRLRVSAANFLPREFNNQ